MSVAVLNAMNTRGRAAICGAISHYNEVILIKWNSCTHNSRHIICLSLLECRLWSNLPL